MTYPTTPRRTRGFHQWLTLLIGVVYLVVGVAGFLVTGFGGFMEHDEDQTLLIFGVNPLHNIVHLVIGVLGIGLWVTSGTARIFGWILLVGYGAAFVYGLYAVGDPDMNFLNANDAANYLHAASALLGLLIAAWPARTPVAQAPGTPPPMPP